MFSCTHNTDKWVIIWFFGKYLIFLFGSAILAFLCRPSFSGGEVNCELFLASYLKVSNFWHFLCKLESQVKVLLMNFDSLQSLGGVEGV